jgi:hypothetical protein
LINLHGYNLDYTGTVGVFINLILTKALHKYKETKIIRRLITAIYMGGGHQLKLSHYIY